VIAQYAERISVVQDLADERAAHPVRHVRTARRVE
jgi:hypothetical protein